MVRSPASIRGRTASTRDAASSNDDTSSGGVLRRLLVGLGLAAVAYVAVRRLRSGGQSADDSDDWHQLSIGESVESGGEAEAGGGQTTSASAGGEAAGEELDPEIEQRTKENVEEEPAEPGEMNVDEEVVDEAIEGDGEAAETDEEE